MKIKAQPSDFEWPSIARQLNARVVKQRDSARRSRRAPAQLGRVQCAI